MRDASTNLSLIKVHLRHWALADLSLRRPATYTDFWKWPDPLITTLAGDLLQLLFAQPGGVGLGASMAGINLSTVVTATAPNRPTVMFNPVLAETSVDTVTLTEANLSLPGFWGDVQRPSKILLSWQDLSGQRRVTEHQGWDARVILHELDVIAGRPFTDLVHRGALRHETLAGKVEASLRGSPHFEKKLDKPIGGNVHYFNAVTLSPNLLGIRETVLRWDARPVDFSEWTTSQLRDLARELFWLQHQLEGVGLAAPQVGLSTRLAVIDNRIDAPIVLINPIIRDKSDKLLTANEGCLSLPWYQGPVERAESVAVTYSNLHGDEVDLSAKGYLARIIQHEIDHLDGILYADRLADPSQLQAIDPDTLASAALSKLLGESI